MKFKFPAEQSAFRREVALHLDSLRLQDGLDAINGDADPRPLYRELAKCGLLGVNWAASLGGRALGFMEAALVADEMGGADPDTLHLLTIQVVGGLLAMHATPEQKRRFLVPMARGDLFAAVLYSEPQAGSDIGAFNGRAVELSDGRFRIKAVKNIFGLKTRFADYGLCALRTGSSRNLLGRFTLFMVPLHAPGVTIDVIPTMQNEQFHRVEIDELVVPAENAIGKQGQGWPLMIDALALERTGLDYHIKARNWLESLCTVIGSCGAPRDDVYELLGRLQAELELGCLQVWHVVDQMDKGAAQDSALAASKWFNSELAKKIAFISCDLIDERIARLNPDTAKALSELEAAYREAPGLTISGGASEIMLDTIAKNLSA